MNKQDNVPQVKTVEEMADLLYGLALAEYCTLSERDGFMYSIDNGCSLDKSNGYCAGFVTGFQKGYLHQQSRIAELEASNDKLREALEACYEFIKVLEEKRIVSNWSGKSGIEQILNDEKSI